MTALINNLDHPPNNENINDDEQNKNISETSPLLPQTIKVDIQGGMKCTDQIGNSKEHIKMLGIALLVAFLSTAIGIAILCTQVSNLTKEIGSIKDFEATFNRGTYTSKSGDLFWGQMHFEENVNFFQAQNICITHGSHLAYVRNIEEFEGVSMMLQSLVPIGYDVAQVWTSAHIDQATNVTTPPDAYIKWFPGNPKKWTGWSGIELRVYRDPNNHKGGFSNFDPAFNGFGALCRR